MVFSNTDLYLADAHCGDEHVRKLFGGSEFLGHNYPLPNLRGPRRAPLILHSRYDSRQSNGRVPELTRNTGIKLNQRLSLRNAD
jgi:hypothetical protein